MKKSFKIIPAIVIIQILTSCNLEQKFKKEFENHVSIADSIHSGGDPFHATDTYFKNEQIIGIEFDANPSCGSYNRKYFISSGIIQKIIVRKYFYTGDCENFDSLLIIEPEHNIIQLYTNGVKRENIKNEKAISKYLIDIQKHIQIINN